MGEELTPDERAALRELANVAEPEGLEDRVVATLRKADVIAPGGRQHSGWLAATAAAILLFVSGMAMQRYVLDDATTTAAGVSGDRYLLLLLEPAGLQIDPVVEAERVVEYGAWAGGLARVGQLEAGEKLDDNSAVVGPDVAGPSPSEKVTGFFIVRAESPEAARELAETSPHVLHGGRVEVRRIEPT